MAAKPTGSGRYKPPARGAARFSEGLQGFKKVVLTGAWPSGVQKTAHVPALRHIWRHPRYKFVLEEGATIGLLTMVGPLGTRPKVLILSIQTQKSSFLQTKHQICPLDGGFKEKRLGHKSNLENIETF